MLCMHRITQPSTIESRTFHCIYKICVVVSVALRSTATRVDEQDNHPASTSSFAKSSNLTDYSYRKSSLSRYPDFILEMSLYSLFTIATLLTSTLSNPLPPQGGHGQPIAIPTPDQKKMCTPSADRTAFTLGVFMSPSYLGTSGQVDGNVDFYVFDGNCTQMPGSPFKSWDGSGNGMKGIQPAGLPWEVEITKFKAPYDQNGQDWVVNAKYGAQFLYPSGGHSNGCTDQTTQTGPQKALWVTIGCPLTGN